jgi:putative ABC transport system substrate-binding protein
MPRGDLSDCPELAEELVRLKVDVIVAPATPAVQAAKQATTTIPIIFPGVADPVAFGFVISLARPGGNITGLTNFSPELSGKRVELLKEALPQISRLAVLRDPRQPPDSFNETQKASQAFALKLQSLEIRNATDVETAFSQMNKERTDAFITLPHPFVTFHMKRILELARKGRMPSTHPDRLWAEAGGLMSDHEPPRTGRTKVGPQNPRSGQLYTRNKPSKSTTHAKVGSKAFAVDDQYVESPPLP